MSGSRRGGRPKAAGLVLFPGAGSDRNHPSLLSIERALAPLPVLRADFPYRKAGRRPPDRAPVLMAAVREAVAEAAARWKVPTNRIVVGGRSMGGRICSMVVADEEDPLDVAALVLIAYPLAPPTRVKAGATAGATRRKPSRAAHLGRIDVPTLCVSGTRDAFGTPARLRRAMGRISGEVTWHWCPDRGHDLRGSDDEIAAAVADWLGVSGARARRRRD